MGEGREEAGAEPSAPKTKTRTRFIFVVGLTLYVLIIWYVGWNNIRQELSSANVWTIVAALIPLTAGIWVRVLKWRYVLGPALPVARLFFFSKAAGNFTPSRLGELSPLAFKKYRSPQLAGWIVVDRLVEGFSTIALGLLGLAMLRLAPWYYIAGLGGLTVGACAFSFYVVSRRGGAFRWLEGRVRQDSFLGSTVRIFETLTTEMTEFLHKGVGIVVMTMVGKLCDLFAIMLIYGAFGKAISFALAATARCALALVNIVPLTPATTGVPHLTMAGIMNYVGDISPEVLVAAVGADVVIMNVAFWSSFGIGVLGLGNKSDGD